MHRIDRMEYKEFVMKVNRSSVEGPNRRGRPLGRWEDQVKEYVHERGVRNWSGQRGSVWIGRGGDPSAMAIPLGDASRGSKVSELLTN